MDHVRGIDQYTLHSEVFYNSLGDTLDKSQLQLPVITGNGQHNHQEGGYIRFRWDRTFPEQSSLWLQAAYDRNQYQLLPYSKYNAESVDIDFQHNFPLLEKHNFTWGAHYRANHNKVFTTEVITLNPQQKTTHFFSGFIRNDFALIPDHILFTLGIRLDHNDFTGLEIQPNTRLMWTPDSKNSIWMAVSRAVRTPSRTEIDGLYNLGSASGSSIQGIPQLPIPILTTLEGNRNFNSEKLLAYELG